MAQAKTAKRFELQVEQRTEFGRRAARALRQEGLVPVCFYSGGEEAHLFVMTATHLRDAMHSGEKIFNVMIDGEQRRAMVKEIQYHPVTDTIIHVDFQGIRLRDIIEIPVSIVVTGSAVGVKEGGVLQQPIHEVVVRCKGADVPDTIEVDVTDLQVGDAIHAGDLKPENYKILLADEITIVSVVVPQKFEEPVVETEDEELDFVDEEGEGEEGEGSKADTKEDDED